MIICFVLGVQLVGSTFIRERNLMPERWVRVAFSTAKCLSSSLYTWTCTARSLFTVTSVKPSLGRIKQWDILYNVHAYDNKILYFTSTVILKNLVLSSLTCDCAS